MFGLGGSEVLVIALVALLVFGPGKIPEVVRTIARGYKELAKLRQQVDSTVAELRQDINLTADLDDKAPRPAAQVLPHPPQKSRAAEGAPPADADSDDYLTGAAGTAAADGPQTAGAEPRAEDGQ